VLVVDDEVDLATTLADVLTSRGFEVTSVHTGTEALEVLARCDVDVVLTDLMMPGMDGIELLRRALGAYPDLVIVLLTGHATVDSALAAMKLGAFDYVQKPVRMATLGPVLSRAIDVRRLRRENLSLREAVAVHEAVREAERRYRSIFENAAEGIFRMAPDGTLALANPAFARMHGYETPDELVRAFGSARVGPIGTGQVGVHGALARGDEVYSCETRIRRADGSDAWLAVTLRAELDESRQVRHYDGIAVDVTERRRISDELREAYETTIEGWARALDLRDKETEGHSRRVTELTYELAHRLGLRGAELVHVRRGALLHDVGKMGVPDAILLKAGPLSDVEWAHMRLHATHGRDLLWPIPFLRPAIDIPWCHHEKWDGSGYPRGLKGEDIPLGARVFAVVDVWDAITNDRPYRPAMSRQQAIDVVLRGVGSHFDPRVVTAFLALIGAPSPR
jgi:PAS domain S-box-containing protein/putative nucleotidyltransferase with HDIG domain